jgi:hypothetical protein
MSAEAQACKQLSHKAKRTTASAKASKHASKKSLSKKKVSKLKKAKKKKEFAKLVKKKKRHVAQQPREPLTDSYIPVSDGIPAPEIVDIQPENQNPVDMSYERTSDEFQSFEIE